jgi:hypothetical protein
MRRACDLDQRFLLHQSALDAVARRLVARKVLGIDGIDRGVVRPVGDEDLVEGDVGHGAAGGLDHRLDGVEHVLGLLGGIADMHDVGILVERQRARDIDHAIRQGARRVGCQGLAGAGRKDGFHGHQLSSFVFARGLMLVFSAPRNSSVDDTQPKNFSIL